MDKNSKISFVIPAYNCESTIEESIKSIFNGNFEDGDEIIIVNDCSKDSTEAKIMDLKKEYAQIIYIKNEVNRGCPASRNVGVRIATNPLIFNLDSDNVLAPDSIKPLKEYLLSENADIAAFSQYYFFQKNINQITHKWIYDKNTLTLSDLLTGHTNPGPGGNFLYTKKSWEKIGGYWEYGNGLHEAWGFTLKQLANGARFVVLQNSFYFHRHGHDSLSITERKKKDESGLTGTKMLMNFADLIDADDLIYVKENLGWFDGLAERPIRLKSKEIGHDGYNIRLEKKNRVVETFKNNKWIQKLYRIYKK